MNLRYITLDPSSESDARVLSGTARLCVQCCRRAYVGERPGRLARATGIRPGLFPLPAATSRKQAGNAGRACPDVSGLDIMAGGLADVYAGALPKENRPISRDGSWEALPQAGLYRMGSGERPE
jgi:hypothetical protein